MDLREPFGVVSSCFGEFTDHDASKESNIEVELNVRSCLFSADKSFAAVGFVDGSLFLLDPSQESRTVVSKISNDVSDFVWVGPLSASPSFASVSSEEFESSMWWVRAQCVHALCFICGSNPQDCVLHVVLVAREGEGVRLSPASLSNSRSGKLRVLRSFEANPEEIVLGKARSGVIIDEEFRPAEFREGAVFTRLFENLNSLTVLLRLREEQGFIVANCMIEISRIRVLSTFSIQEADVPRDRIVFCCRQGFLVGVGVGLLQFWRCSDGAHAVPANGLLDKFNPTLCELSHDASRLAIVGESEGGPGFILFDLHDVIFASEWTRSSRSRDLDRLKMCDPVLQKKAEPWYESAAWSSSPSTESGRSSAEGREVERLPVQYFSGHDWKLDALAVSCNGVLSLNALNGKNERFFVLCESDGEIYGCKVTPERRWFPVLDCVKEPEVLSLGSGRSCANSSSSACSSVLAVYKPFHGSDAAERQRNFIHRLIRETVISKGTEEAVNLCRRNSWDDVVLNVFIVQLEIGLTFHQWDLVQRALSRVTTASSRLLAAQSLHKFILDRSRGSDSFFAWVVCEALSFLALTAMDLATMLEESQGMLVVSDSGTHVLSKNERECLGEGLEMSDCARYIREVAKLICEIRTAGSDVVEFSLSSGKGASRGRKIDLLAQLPCPSAVFSCSLSREQAVHAAIEEGRLVFASYCLLFERELSLLDVEAGEICRLRMARPEERLALPQRAKEVLYSEVVRASGTDIWQAVCQFAHWLGYQLMARDPVGAVSILSLTGEGTRELVKCAVWRTGQRSVRAAADALFGGSLSKAEQAVLSFLSQCESMYRSVTYHGQFLDISSKGERCRPFLFSPSNPSCAFSVEMDGGTPSEKRSYAMHGHAQSVDSIVMREGMQKRHRASSASSSLAIEVVPPSSVPEVPTMGARREQRQLSDVSIASAADADDQTHPALPEDAPLVVKSRKRRKRKIRTVDASPIPEPSPEDKEKSVTTPASVVAPNELGMMSSLPTTGESIDEEPQQHEKGHESFSSTSQSQLLDNGRVRSHSQGRHIDKHIAPSGAVGEEWTTWIDAPNAETVTGISSSRAFSGGNDYLHLHAEWAEAWDDRTRERVLFEPRQRNISSRDLEDVVKVRTWLNFYALHADVRGFVHLFRALLRKVVISLDSKAAFVGGHGEVDDTVRSTLDLLRSECVVFPKALCRAMEREVLPRLISLSRYGHVPYYTSFVETMMRQNSGDHVAVAEMVSAFAEAGVLFSLSRRPGDLPSLSPEQAMTWCALSRSPAFHRDVTSFWNQEARSRARLVNGYATWWNVQRSEQELIAESDAGGRNFGLWAFRSGDGVRMGTSWYGWGSDDRSYPCTVSELLARGDLYAALATICCSGESLHFCFTRLGEDIVGASDGTTVEGRVHPLACNSDLLERMARGSLKDAMFPDVSVPTENLSTLQGRRDRNLRSIVGDVSLLGVIGALFGMSLGRLDAEGSFLMPHMDPGSTLCRVEPSPPILDVELSKGVEFVPERLSSPLRSFYDAAEDMKYACGLEIEWFLMNGMPLLALQRWNGYVAGKWGDDDNKTAKEQRAKERREVCKRVYHLAFSIFLHDDATEKLNDALVSSGRLGPNGSQFGNCEHLAGLAPACITFLQLLGFRSRPLRVDLAAFAACRALASSMTPGAGPLRSASSLWAVFCRFAHFGELEDLVVDRGSVERDRERLLDDESGEHREQPEAAKSPEALVKRWLESVVFDPPEARAYPTTIPSYATRLAATSHSSRSSASDALTRRSSRSSLTRRSFGPSAAGATMGGAGPFSTDAEILLSLFCSVHNLRRPTTLIASLLRTCDSSGSSGVAGTVESAGAGERRVSAHWITVLRQVEEDEISLPLFRRLVAAEVPYESPMRTHLAMGCGGANLVVDKENEADVYYGWSVEAFPSFFQYVSSRTRRATVSPYIALPLSHQHDRDRVLECVLHFSQPFYARFPTDLALNDSDTGGDGNKLSTADVSTYGLFLDAIEYSAPLLAVIAPYIGALASLRGSEQGETAKFVAEELSLPVRQHSFISFCIASAASAPSALQPAVSAAMGTGAVGGKQPSTPSRRPSLDLAKDLSEWENPLRALHVNRFRESSSILFSGSRSVTDAASRTGATASLAPSTVAASLYPPQQKQPDDNDVQTSVSNAYDLMRSWGADDLSGVICAMVAERLCSWLLRAFALYDPKSVFISFLQFVWSFDQGRVSDAESNLSTFVTECGRYYSHAREDTDWGVLGSLQAIGTCAEQVVTLMVSSQRSLHEHESLLRVLANCSFSGFAGKCYRSFLHVRAADPSVCAQFSLFVDDPADVVAALVSLEHFSTARAVASEFGLDTAPISKLEVAHVIHCARSSILWAHKSERGNLWRRASSMLLDGGVSAPDGGAFFLGLANAKSSPEEAEDVQNLLQLAFDWLSGSLTRSDPVWPADELIRLENAVWLSSVNSAVRFPLESEDVMEREFAERIGSNNDLRECDGGPGPGVGTDRASHSRRSSASSSSDLWIRPVMDDDAGLRDISGPPSPAPLRGDFDDSEGEGESASASARVSMTSSSPSDSVVTMALSRLGAVGDHGGDRAEDTSMEFGDGCPDYDVSMLTDLISKLLSAGQLKRAKQICARFRFTSRDVRIVDEAYQLAIHGTNPGRLPSVLTTALSAKGIRFPPQQMALQGGITSVRLTESEMISSSLAYAPDIPVDDGRSFADLGMSVGMSIATNALSGSSLVSGSIPSGAYSLDVLLALDGLAQLSAHARRFVEKIRVNYWAAMVLNRTYRSVARKDPYVVLTLLLGAKQKGRTTLRIEQITKFIKMMGLRPSKVANRIVSVLWRRLKSELLQIGGRSIPRSSPVGIAGGEDTKPSATEAPRLSGDSEFFRELLRCCDAELLGRGLIERLVLAKQLKPDSLAYRMEVELLILAHTAFSTVGSLRGIDDVLARLNARTKIYVNAGEVQCLARALHGIARYREFEYLIDLLIQLNHYECLLSKATRDTEQELDLKRTLARVLQRRFKDAECADNVKDEGVDELVEQMEMMFMRFSMFKELGEVLQQKATKWVNRYLDKKWKEPQRHLLMDAAQALMDAAEWYERDGYLRVARKCVDLSRLLMLQVRLVDLHGSAAARIVNRSPAEARSLLNTLPVFGDALVVSRAYGIGFGATEWVGPLYSFVIVKGDQSYLRAFLKGFTPDAVIFSELAMKVKAGGFKHASSAAQNFASLLEAGLPDRAYRVACLREAGLTQAASRLFEATPGLEPV